MKIIFIFTILIIVLTHSFAQTPSIPLKGYNLVWHDEFNGNNLDRSKWKFRQLGKRGDAYNTPSAIRLDGDGHLVIEVSQKNDSVFAGIIDTENLFATRYGYFECRAIPVKTPGAWSGFWLQSSMNGENGTPGANGAEIDIFEYFPHEKKDSVSHTIHWGGYGATHKKAGPVWGALGKGVNGFHTFGLEWTPTSYTTYVDGAKTYSGNTLISKVPEFLLLSVEVNKQIAGPLNKKDLPDKFVVDYVRVYKTSD